MRKVLIFSLLLLTNVYFAEAQQTRPTPQPNQQQKEITNRRNPSTREMQQQERLSQIRTQNAELDDMLRSVKQTPSEVNNIYRKSKKEERELLTPAQADLDTYSNFLNQRKTGILKLRADTGCAENSKVIIANDECLKFSMPGAGSSYSFRTNDYRLRRLADLTFIDDKFSAFGLLTQILFVEIGDVPIDNVTLDSEQVKFLVNFQPQSEFEKFKEIHHKLVTVGIKNGNSLYKREITPAANMTYALRSTAYEAEVFRAYEDEVYDEFSFDQRKDVIIIFRVIRKNPNQDITILWKELSRKNSPKLKNIPENID